ncbi:PREDICTED: uncharacterized protein LOC103321693 [Prunus mume]|uniref:RING-type E3 ubiquitin transferase n=1 Tax=Prunus mume TaxID=102107 RepID=A0ABM0NA75_PRUMU|nr:PREDICTED: uncharacterized protein LOC103321693 [Prunus mume]
MEVEDFEVHHEKDSLDFYVLLLTPHLLGSYEPSSPARFLVKFDYQVNHIYYDIRSSDDIGTRRETLVDQFQEKDEKTIEFEKPVLRKCGESYEFLSQVLSSFGIASSDENAGLHDQIVDGIIKWGRKIRQEIFSDERPEVWGLYVHIGNDHAMYRCEEFLKGKVRWKSMAASNYKGMVSIKRVLKKVIDGKLGSCVDVKEEGTKRKGRRITGSDNAKEEGWSPLQPSNRSALDSYLVLSKAMLSFGITRDRVVRDIVDEIPCLVASVMRESLAAAEVKMVPASESSIKKVLKKVIVGQGGESIRRNYLSVSDDVKEEEERKRRRISVSESESCSVCMDEFEEGTTVAWMPCSHVFHGECIVNWLRQSHYCPVAALRCRLIDENLCLIGSM